MPQSEATAPSFRISGKRETNHFISSELTSGLEDQAWALVAFCFSAVWLQ